VTREHIKQVIQYFKQEHKKAHDSTVLHKLDIIANL